MISAYQPPAQLHRTLLWSRRAVNCTQRLPIFYKTQKEGEALLLYTRLHNPSVLGFLEPVYQLTERLLNVCAHSGVV